ncbi:MAG TPA: glycerophosphoryl diester phosphodiesterase membrane domain-containing protein [Thermomicrobiales bacterium]|nr:glycerophosphoryl diester phosphodiesterase membrane domain-containing protein [Thermomicrobiales bacterium]
MSMSHPGPRLRPMTAGDIIDEAINLYRRHFRMFIVIGAFAIVPLSVVQIVLSLAGDQSDLVFVGVSSLITTGLSVLVYVALWTAMARASASVFLNEPMDERRAYSDVVGRFGTALLLAIVYAIVVMALSFVFFIGVYFAIAWIFALHVLIIERRGIGDALSRSRALVSGHWWRVLGVGLVAVIIQFVIVIAFSIPAMAAGGSTMLSDPFAEMSPVATLLATIGNAAGTIIAGPILYCTVTLLYFDLRMRKEGFDLEYQAREMEVALDQAPAPGRGF